jgi:DNA-directed RNA polymerase specialized sigma24 family protein
MIAAKPSCAKFERPLPGDRERTVLVMTFFDDSNADEVARATGITAGNARVVRHRGIERLRRCLEGQVHGA